MRTLLSALALSLLLTAAARPVSAQKPPPTYQLMDYGPFLCATYEAKVPKGNVAYRGVAVPFEVATTGEGGGKIKAGVIFDTEMLRYMVGWSGGFLKFDGVAFSGNHGANPGPSGTVLFSTTPTPGWARNGDLKDPRTADYVKDPRNVGYGTLPADWGRYKGLYRSDSGVVFKYTVGGTEVLDMPSVEDVGQGQNVCFTRTLNIGPRGVPLTMVLADVEGMTNAASDGKFVSMEGGENAMAVRLKGGMSGASLEMLERSRILLKIPADTLPVQIVVRLWAGPKKAHDAAFAALGVGPDARDLAPLTKGGKARFTQTVATKGVRGEDKNAYTVDKINVPFNNPYKSWMRFGALDFLADGRAVITTWSGDVWQVSGIDDALQNVTWKRIAAGLFQPLGVKVVGEQIYVLGRDGITRLHDTNGDGEIDFYECFNNDFLVTKNFHEFIFDLHTDHEGNFYFIKGGPVKPGGRGWDHVTSSHGSLFKVSKDGSKLEVIARGFRAPNGMCVGPHDEITTGDNEGTWMPMCPINWIKPGGFYGVPEFSSRTPLPTQRDNPLCWMPKEIDNSGGCQVWITGNKFGPLSGQLLHTSYGTCTLYVVLKEDVGGQMQGGVTAVPLKFDTGIMRARYLESQNALYLVGLKGWQTTASQEGGFYRVRYTGKPANLVVDLHVRPSTIQLTFTDPLDKAAVEDVDNYNLQRWNYKWTQNYGSPHFSADKPREQGRDDMEVESASLSADGKTVTLKVADLKPVMQMRLVYQLKSAGGAPVRGAIHHTVNVVGDMAGEVHVGEYRIVPRKN